MNQIDPEKLIEELKMLVENLMARKRRQAIHDEKDVSIASKN